MGNSVHHCLSKLILRSVTFSRGSQVLRRWHPSLTDSLSR